MRTKACASEEKHNWKYANLQSSFKQVEGFDHVSVRLVHLDKCEKTTEAGARGLRGHAKPLLYGRQQWRLVAHGKLHLCSDAKRSRCKSQRLDQVGLHLEWVIDVDVANGR